MHGTGTPLGDPVEVNAAADVLLHGSFSSAAAAPGVVARQSPVSLLASKSWHGHGEPAAGLIALQHSAVAAAQLMRHAMLHLRNLNPYIIGILDQLPTQQQGKGMAASRQLAPLPMVSGEQQVVAANSSFAFMGTNASVISVTCLPKDCSFDQGVTAKPLPWQSSRQWVVPEVPLLAARLSSVSSSTVVFAANLAAVQLSYIWDHQVAGRVIFPGAGYMEMAAAALRLTEPGEAAPANGSNGRSLMFLGHLSIPAALVLPAKEDSSELPVLECRLQLHDGGIRIASEGGRGSGTVTHVTATAGFALGAGAEAKRDSTLATVAVGFLERVVPAFAGNTAAADRGAVAAIAASSHNDGCVVDVGMMDSFLQLGQVFILDRLASQGMYVPSGLELLVIEQESFQAASQPCMAYAQPAAGVNMGSRVAVSDYVLVGPTGSTLCSIRGMAAKPMAMPSPSIASKPVHKAVTATQQQAEREMQVLYETTWQVAAVEDCHTPGQDVVEVVAPGLDFRGASSLEAVSSGLAAMQGLASMYSSSSKHEVQLQGWGDYGALGSLLHGEASAAALAGSQQAAMMQVWAQEEPSRVLSVQQKQELHAAVGSSFTRQNTKLMVSEHNSAATGDVHGALSGSGVTMLPRLLPSGAAELPSKFQMQALPRGALDNLVPQVMEGWQINREKEVLVKVEAVGINFRDVLNVLGMYPGDPGHPGSDFAGLVVEGQGAGQAVFGLSPGCLASHVVCSAEMLAPMPSNISFEEAATAPTVLVTVQAALKQLAVVAAGDTLLLHGAAGGVGLAALQVATSVGARVVATAGGPAKRALVRQLGVKLTGSSRDTMFVEDLAIAGGATVLLNTLTSPGMLASSLAGLRPGARVVEISKRDIWNTSAIAAERPDVSYNLLAVDFMPGKVLQQLLGQVSLGLASGELAPLQTVVHSMAAVRAALRQMAQAKHVGKVVVSMAIAETGKAMGAGQGSSNSALGSKQWGTALVTGGSGALGQLVTNWLAAQQVQHILLSSRAGQLPHGLLVKMQDPQERLFPCCISVTAGDAAVREDVAAVLEDLSYSVVHPPCGTLLHAGGVLADAAIANQTCAGARQVLAPKATAMKLLSKYMSATPMAGAVLFSSVAALLGSAGQANYAAGNATLDAAARALRVAGRPVVSVQFGAWAGAGMAAATAAKAEAIGVGALQPEQGLKALEVALNSSR
jgi:NADPH:quinone reductase-like Zn-dependent oxidoreductase